MKCTKIIRDMSHAICYGRISMARRLTLETTVRSNNHSLSRVISNSITYLVTLINNPALSLYNGELPYASTVPGYGSVNKDQKVVVSNTTIGYLVVFL